MSLIFSLSELSCWATPLEYFCFAQRSEKLKTNSRPQWISGTGRAETTTRLVGLHTTCMVATNSTAPVALQHIKPELSCCSQAPGSSPGAASQWRNDWACTEMTGLFNLKGGRLLRLIGWSISVCADLNVTSVTVCVPVVNAGETDVILHPCHRTRVVNLPDWVHSIAHETSTFGATLFSQRDHLVSFCSITWTWFVLTSCRVIPSSLTMSR